MKNIVISIFTNFVQNCNVFLKNINKYNIIIELLSCTLIVERTSLFRNKPLQCLS